MGVLVYAALKIAHVYGGPNGYGRDKKGRPLNATDWYSELFQLLAITTAWWLVMWVRLPYVIQGLSMPAKGIGRWWSTTTIWWRLTKSERALLKQQRQNEQHLRELFVERELNRLQQERIALSQLHLDATRDQYPADLEARAVEVSPLDTKQAAAD